MTIVFRGLRRFFCRHRQVYGKVNGYGECSCRRCGLTFPGWSA